jgi:Glycosyl hydrolase family 99
MEGLRPPAWTIAATLSCALAVSSSTIGSSFAAGPRAHTQSFPAGADAFVTPAQPRRNFGRARDLRVGPERTARAYVRFTIRGVQGIVSRADLRVFVRSGSGARLLVHPLSGQGWSERRITFANAPRAGAPVAAGRASGGWTAVDVTRLVTRSGVVSLALSSSRLVRLGSRESGQGPRLVLEVGPAQPSFPIRAAFYYPWYPEAWRQGGLSPFTKYHPSLGFYDSGDPAVIRRHMAAMQYGRIEAGIVSWWGRQDVTDDRLQTILDVTTRAKSAFRWAVYYEPEGQGDPDPDVLAADLAYIRNRYASNPSYLKIGRRFVVFAYADARDSCDMAARWARAAAENVFVVLKVVSHFRDCPQQPQAWHQYAPATAVQRSGASYSISPGFDKAGEPGPRLGRDLGRWREDVRAMVASNARFQLVTTFNEWGEGTAIESASEWATSSGYGAYLDALHDIGRAGAPRPDVASRHATRFRRPGPSG